MSAVAETPVVATRRQGRVMVVEIANPPVNALSAAVRQGLLSALRAAEAARGVTALVLTGGAARFVAGADIREFGHPPVPPSLPEVLEAIAGSPLPVVAAIGGAALGGGLELALACDGRVANIGASLGLPEVNLGIIPGAGGTQRLPRLIGLARAIEMIAGGKPVPAKKAAGMGLVDRVVEGDPLPAAIALAETLTGKHRLSDLTPPATGDVEAAIAAACPRGKAPAAVLAAIKVIREGAALPFAEGLALERRTFIELRDSEEAAARRHLFLAERSAPRIDGLSAPAKAIGLVGVIGAGTMGTGITLALIAAGFPVILVERDAAGLDRGIERIRDQLARRVAASRLTAEAMAAQLALITGATELATLAPVDLVIEAAFEDMAVKRELFATLDRITRPDAILATNTSYLDVNEIADVTTRPEKVLGLHFFSPAHVMRLLEIVRAAQTGDEALATALALAKKIGKLAVVAGVCDGFIGNRIFSAYRRQCEFLLEEGATPEAVDGALEAFGFAMGPFAVADLAGLDISWSRRKRLAASRDPRERYSSVADTLCEAGRFGQKTGAGWYRYPGREPDPIVHRAIEDAAARAGITRRPLGPAEIQQRVLAAMVNEAALVLEDGIAARPSDIDIVLVHGYGFPAAKGGPLFWASRQERAALETALEAVAQSTGFGFRRGRLPTLPSET
ncbi:3-hydroxyacyl-CoA dehydrogenase NAD-binding domain-containing protein [Zavarzinia compransoris]|uniref:3-hydroxyacyl-CoA dehydrogenase n=1 Tax=Zavarzinia compransoris TaxID=1264899 RepID=A0A317E3M5_9PROT|nr:3-hydroxyacyl-CoA dehydrogenase NAD-binding domain-containing protein [Zavarzinia compransoris]PWR20984.1 3-hydroxyacyl-CoA dehydrogenase [Zavarzinia compransoris]TDP44014.1 3-hydroxyacyl-CoA dehydrogenase [Zavarzinia compransoris]